MGGLKDLITGDASELDDWLDADVELSETEVMTLAHQSLIAELRELEGRMTKLADRQKYYGDEIDYDTFEFLLREIQRVIKNFG